MCRASEPLHSADSVDEVAHELGFQPFTAQSSPSQLSRDTRVDRSAACAEPALDRCGSALLKMLISAMERRLRARRAYLGLLLVAAACHTGERLDWSDFEFSSAEPDTPDVSSAEAPTMEAATPDPRSVPDVEPERPDPLRDVPERTIPESTPPEGASGGGPVDGKGDPDAGRFAAAAPSRDGGANNADARGTSDGGHDHDAGPLPPSATQVCPAPGGGPQEVRVLPNGGDGTCWVGESWELGFARAAGSLTITERLVVVRSYLFGGALSAKTQVYNGDGHPLRSCVAVDITAGGGQWREIAFEHTTCPGAAFARVTAHSSQDGDL
jgi:hypothetical protein